MLKFGTERELKESERGKKGWGPKRTPSFPSWSCFNGTGAFENGLALQLLKAPWPISLPARSCGAVTILGPLACLFYSCADRTMEGYLHFFSVYNHSHKCYQMDESPERVDWAVHPCALSLVSMSPSLWEQDYLGFSLVLGLGPINCMYLQRCLSMIKWTIRETY